LNEHLLTPSKLDIAPDKTIALIDFKRLNTGLSNRLINNRPYGSHRNLGSIALELCWIAAGRGHLYLHGRQQLWDYAAAQLILTETGLAVETLEGETLFDGSLAPKSALTASNPSLFHFWRDYLNAEMTQP